MRGKCWHPCCLPPTASRQVAVLKAPTAQQTKLERWSSLAIAPSLGRLQRAGEIARDAAQWSLDPQVVAVLVVLGSGSSGSGSAGW